MEGMVVVRWDKIKNLLFRGILRLLYREDRTVTGSKDFIEAIQG